MRSILLAILILPLCFAANDKALQLPQANDLHLPKSTQKILSDFNDKKNQSIEAYRNEIIKERDKMIKELEKLFDIELKKGNLNGAAAIKAHKDCLKGNVVIHFKIDCPPKTEPGGGDGLKSILLEHRWQHDGKDFYAFDKSGKFFTEGKSGTWSSGEDGRTVTIVWKEDGKIETIVIDGTVGTFRGKPFLPYQH